MRKQVFEEQDKLMKLVDTKRSKNPKQSNLNINQQSEESVELVKSTLSDSGVPGKVITVLQSKSKDKVEPLKTTEGLQKSTKVARSKKRKLEETTVVDSQVTPQQKKKKADNKAEVNLASIFSNFHYNLLT